MKSMRTLKSILIFIIILSGTIGYCQQQYSTVQSDTLKILFIGNSFTGYNNMPGILKELAITSKKQIAIACILSYGRCLYEISQNPQVKEKINQQKWDFVVLQDGPHNAAYPDSYQALIPYAPYSPLPLTLKIIRDLALANCENTRVVYFMPWAFKDGITWIAGQTDTYQDMQKKIHDNAIQFANELNLIIAPVGWAWYRVIQERPEIDLFNPDWSHASLDGSYLTACVFYAVFFQQRVTSSYFGNLSADRAQYFQAVASATVLDSLKRWRIPITKVTQDALQLPLNFKLYQNFPNPFNAQTTIQFSLSQSAIVSLDIYNISGERVKTLLRGKDCQAGLHCVNWDGKNDSGIDISSGPFLCQMKTNGLVEMKKILLLK